MAIPALVKDFKEFLKSLNSNGVEYLLIGGYAVGIHGYIRATGDLDIWVRINPENAAKIDRALREFGFVTPALKPDLFLAPNNVIRMACHLFELRFSPPSLASISNRAMPRRR